MKKLISYVFPVYNEEETIPVLYSELTKSIRSIESKYDFEFIFINDGSRDKSLEQLSVLHNKDHRIIILNFSRNFGHQMAITAGVDYAKGDAVIVMDADLQDPPLVAVELIEKWEQGFDVVYAQRRSRQDGAFKKHTAYAFYRILNKLAEINIPNDTGDFRLMDKKVTDALKQFRERNRFMRGLVSFVGFNQTVVLFDRNKRYAGTTNYPFRKMLRLALDAVTSFSTAPLKIITQFGFFVSFLSLIGILYAIGMRIFFPEFTVSGWTMIIISVLFMGGIQLIMLGILGTYIGRIYLEVQGRPLYIVSSVMEKSH